MSCVAATAKRRRRQARQGYVHMAPMRRPRYPSPGDSSKNEVKK